MPICSRCGIDQPDEAFSEESQPLCETCYEIELEEEAAGGEVGNDSPHHHHKTQQQQQQQGEEDDDGEEEIELQEEGEGTDVKKKKKPYKPISLSNAARITDEDGKLRTTASTTTTSHAEQEGGEGPQTGLADPPDLALLEPLVEAIEARGYSSGFGLDSRDILKHRLQRVLFDETNHVITWLTRPLIPALLLLGGADSDAIHVRVAPLNIQDEAVMEKQTLLHWVCQWKLLQLQCGWKGHDDMVDLLIRAGAPVDATLKNGCTPLFFAVKYGTVDTVRLLMESPGRANPRHTDRLGQTCLRNALPQASPYVIKYLLQYIPADETFVTETTLEDGSSSSSSKVRINALDILVTEFVTPDPDVSWVTLGMPSVDDYARCIILFLQHGVRLSPHYPDVTYFLGHYLQSSIKARKRLFYTRKIADLLFGQWLPPLVREEIRTDDVDEANGHPNSLADGDSEEEYVIVNKCAPSDSSNSQTNTTSTRGCPHCRDRHSNRTSRDLTLITLHCGHQFCLEHIRNHFTSIHAATDLRKAKSCPICVRPLGQDVLGDDAPTEENELDVSLEQQRRLGLAQLALEQLQFECRARNLEVPRNELKEHCLESLVADWQDFTVPQNYMEAGDDDEMQMSSRLIFELSMSRTMISQDHYLWVAPTEGSVMIPITVKGIPIMALISTTSPYTVVSPRFVEMFGFRVNPNLQFTASNPLKFTRAQGDEDALPSQDRPIDNNAMDEEPAPRPKPNMITAPEVHLTAVEDFVFTLGNNSAEPGIDVRLDSVFQVCEPNTHSFPVGVVLGLDFFQAAAWSQMSVEVDLEVCLGRTIAFFTGGLKRNKSEPNLHFDLVEPRRADYIEEELRYYSHDGKSFWTPLWHVYVSKHDSCLSLAQYLMKPQSPPKRGESLPEKREQIEMTECAYCCRKFPFVPRGETRSVWEILMSRQKDTGMIKCSLCGNEKPTYYCDKTCQQKAQAAHSAWRHNGMDLSEHIDNRDLKAKDKTTLRLVLSTLFWMGVVYFASSLGEWGRPGSKLGHITEESSKHDNVIPGQDDDSKPFSASSSPEDGFVTEL